MRAFAATALLAAGARAAPADIPTVQICADSAKTPPCYNMPVVGQGSCCGAYNISSWLSAGGLHIDTSVDYGSQPTIAKAVVDSGVPRASLWITSKLNVESCALDMSADLQSLVLAPLGMAYVDLRECARVANCAQRGAARPRAAAARRAPALRLTLRGAAAAPPLTSFPPSRRSPPPPRGPLGDGQEPAPAVL
jgi:hypothetical protein